MNIFSTRLLLFVILLLVVLFFIFFSCKLFGGKSYISEGFMNNSSNNLAIKMTSEFKKIYSNDLFSIWEPLPIENFYPIGHYISFSGKPYVGMLVDSDENSKPTDFALVANINEDYSIWRAIPNDDYKSIGHIISNNKPSIHSIRCIKKDNLIPDELKDRVVDNLEYNIWSMKNNDLFLANVKANNNIPFDTPYYININKTITPKNIKAKTTSKYELLYTLDNSDLNKSVSFWRPIADDNFISLGDIALSNNENPNNNIESVIIHKSIIKYPTGYGSSYEAKITNNNNIYTFWKPQAPPGYVCLSYIINNNKNEPSETNIIGCIPFDYINIIRGNELREEVWNNKPNEMSISILKDKSSRYICTKENQNINILFSLNEDFLDMETDRTDTNIDIILTYTLNDDLNINYSEKVREKSLVKTIGNKFDVYHNRLINIIFNVEEKKIYLTIRARQLGSHELTSIELANAIMDLMLTNDIKILNENRKHLYTLTTIVISKQKEIFLDNSKYDNI